MIGEYSAQISNELKNKFSEVEWQTMKAARNYYVPVYRGIDWRRVWETLKRDMLQLKIKVEKIVANLS